MSSPELLPAEEFGHALLSVPFRAQAGNNADAAGHAPSSREERVDNARPPAPCRRSVDAALTRQSLHGRKGSGLNRVMDFTDERDQWPRHLKSSTLSRVPTDSSGVYFAPLVT